MTLTNLQVIEAANLLQNLDASFPLRSAVRINRAQEALENEEKDISERREEINKSHRATGEEGEQIYLVMAGQEEPDEMTEEEIEEADLPEDARIQAKIEDEQARREDIQDLLAEDSKLDTGQLDQVLPEEFDEIEKAFKGERVSEILDALEKTLDLSTTEKEQAEDTLKEVLQDGVRLSDTKGIQFLFPLEA
jgi:hypothetical protein